MKLRNPGDKNRYDFLDKECLGRECFSPGMYNHYNTAINGQRSATHQTAQCMHRAYHGCNTELFPFDEKLAKQRKKEGWK